MTELDIEVSIGPVRAIDIASLVTGGVVISGPARLMGWSVRDAGLENNQSVYGSVIAPAAGAVIVQAPGLAQADYDIRWQVELTGAAAAGDSNNFGLYAGATLLLTSENAGAAGVYPQTPTTFYDEFGQVLAVKAIGAGTAAVTYAAQMALTPRDVAGPILQLRDGNSELAEVYSPVFGAATQWFGPSGIRIHNQIKPLVNVGTLLGAIYIAYYQELP
jgi:hypothetical protein